MLESVLEVVSTVLVTKVLAFQGIVILDVEDYQPCSCLWHVGLTCCIGVSLPSMGED